MPTQTKTSRASRTANRRAGLSAASADRHDLYQSSVQCVEAEIDFVDNTFRRLRGRRAALLREDFCGTANTSCEWVRRRSTNRAVGVDIDPAPLAWGREHNLSKLSEEQAARLTLVQGDVLTARARRGERFDAVLAMNFSYWCLTTREVMRRYFASVRRALADDGIFFLDFYGGSDAFREMQETRRCRAAGGAFTYVWDQERYNPITGEMICRIHFRFADGTAMNNAFSYRWRLWTLPEIRELLSEAGFERVTVYWEGDDGEGGGNGIFRPSTRGEACPAFVSYIVAER